MSTFIPAEILRKKRDGFELSSDEIHFLITGMLKGDVADYQMAAFLMASFCRGLNSAETVALTREMKNSGRSLNWSELLSHASAKLKDRPLSDKHSSGGVGDKVSLILAPLCAACGLSVPMMSGRGLGHTGGTVDKLESIAGFNMYPSEELMVRALLENGVCMMAQADDLCPADKKLYALRDVTGTVESVQLITASIVSKKWAEGIQSIVYDVKCGEGAFMSDLSSAQKLAQSLVQVSTGAGLKAKALITEMSTPLGSMVGNALEIRESMWILQQSFPTEKHRQIAQSLTELSIRLSAEMLCLSGLCKTLEDAISRCENALKSGQAWSVFEKMLLIQGANPQWQESLAQAPHVLDLPSPQAGVIGKITSRALGLAGLEIGVGRKRKEDSIDPAVGFELLVQEGDSVSAEQSLMKVHVREPSQLKSIEKQLYSIFHFSEENSSNQQHRTTPQSLVLEEVLP